MGDRSMVPACGGGRTRGEGAVSIGGKEVQMVEAQSLPNMYEDMPASSEDLQVDVKELDALLAVYGTLRSFSFLFRLSPFSLKTFCHELNQSRMSTLIDEITVQLMKTIHDFPPEVESENADDNAIKYTGDPEYVYMITADMHKLITDPVWKYLDNLTWPEFMRRLLTATNYSTDGVLKIEEWLAKKEWYTLPISAKITSIHYLIDLVLDSPMARVMINGWEEQKGQCFVNEKDELRPGKR